MKATILVLFLILGMSWNGCQKENFSTDLAGKWEWVSTSGGIDGVYQTPQTLGYTFDVVFTKDGTFEKYDKNNQLVTTYPYTIVKAISIFDNKEHDMIQLNGSMNSSFEIRRDSLFLFQEAFDGFNEVFVRKK